MRTELETGVSEEAWAALIRYGRHDPECGGGVLGTTCTCGLTALLREWAEKLGRPKALAAVRLSFSEADAAPLERIEAQVAQALREGGFVVERVNIEWLVSE